MSADRAPAAARAPMHDRLTEATLAVIRERGPAGATTREIARAAGVSEGSLYNHFAGKTDLISAAMADVAGGIRAAVQRLYERTGRASVESNLADFAVRAIAHFRELLPIASAAIGDPETMRWVRQRQPDGVLPGLVAGNLALAGYVEAEMERGRVDASLSAPYIAALLLGGCQQYAFLSLFAETQELGERTGVAPEPGRYARQLVAALLRPAIVRR